METLNILALSMGASWASGINLYAAVLMLGLMHSTGNIALPPDLVVLSSPPVMLAAGLMYAIQFIADKIPGVDNAWDTLHTFIRIPAGAVLAAGAVGELGQGAEIAALLLGGGLAAGTHAAKAGNRVMMNASPAVFAGWGVSITEDLAVLTGLWAALNHPWLFIGALIVFVLFVIWILPKIWRGIKKVFSFLGRLSGLNRPAEETDKPPEPEKDNENG